MTKRRRFKRRSGCHLRSLHIESLEARQLLAADLVDPGHHVSEFVAAFCTAESTVLNNAKSVHRQEGLQDSQGDLVHSPSTGGEFSSEIDISDVIDDVLQGVLIDEVGPVEELNFGGDVNGDGTADLMIGMFHPVKPVSGIGAFVVFGEKTGFTAPVKASRLDGSNGFALPSYIRANGYSIDSAGDFNNDGINDIVVGAPNAAPDRDWVSQAVVVYGGIDFPNGTDGLPARTAIEESPRLQPLPYKSPHGGTGFVRSVSGNDSRLYTVSSAGDVNGDGLDDILFGARDSNNANRSYVLFGGHEGYTNSFDGENGFEILGIPGTDNLGAHSVDSGDINGDGISDLIISSASANRNGTQTGTVYVVYGHAGDWPATLSIGSVDDGVHGFAIHGSKVGDQVGRSVHSAGDVNGDGYEDIVIGAQNADPNGEDSGQAYVVFGAASGIRANVFLDTLNGASGFTVNGIAAGDALGASVSTAGDLNGDGFDDIILGAPGANNARGQSFVIFGQATGFDASIELSELTENAGFVINGSVGNSFGSAVTGGYDFNGDGVDDVAIAAKNARGSNNGQVYVLYGRGSNVAQNSPPKGIELSSVVVPEGITGAVVGQVFVDDPDANDSHVLEVSDSRFEIIQGELRLKENLSLNHSDEPQVLLRITATDSAGESVSEDFQLAVRKDNSTPNASDDHIATKKNVPLVIEFSDLLANDTDPDGDPLTISEWTQAEKGSVVLNGDGTLTYTPEPDFHGTDQFRYTISDGELTDSGSVVVHVSDVNEGPKTGDDHVNTNEDEVLVLRIADLLANDTDPEGDSLTITEWFQAEHGSIVVNGDGTLTYIPKPSFHGIDRFRYAVTDGESSDTGQVIVSIAGRNSPPKAGDNDVLTKQGESLLINIAELVSNDSDPDRDVLVVTEWLAPESGTLAVNGDGTLTYTPEPGFHGIDRFRYIISDGELTDTGLVVVHISEVNDPPKTGDDHVGTNEDEPLVLRVADLVANDSDPDGDSLSITEWRQPEHGSLVVHDDGTLTYTPEPGFHGMDRFRYIISDGELADTGLVVVHISEVNAPPKTGDDHVGTSENVPLVLSIADLAANDTDPDGDSLSITEWRQPEHGSLVVHDDGTLTYTPEPGFHGMDRFRYIVSDGELTDTGLVVLHISEVNEAPKTGDDHVGTNEDEPLVLSIADLIANDTDPDGDSLFVTEWLQAEHGSIVINGDGTLTYTPEPGFHGIDRFRYIISDGELTDTGLVVVHISEVNDPPKTGDDHVGTNEDESLVLRIADLAANDTDPDGDSLSITEWRQPEHGALVVNGDGTITYTPEPGFHGIDRFRYVISDGELTDTGLVVVHISAVNDPPKTGDDHVGTNEDEPLVLRIADLVANDTDPNGDSLSITDWCQPEHGSLVVHDDGTLTYTPEPGFHGMDRFRYIISDGELTDTGLVVVHISEVNDPPKTGDDHVGTNEDEPLVLNIADLVANDSDPDGDSLFVTEWLQAEHGSIVINGDGTLTYIPKPGFHGFDRFRYTLTDGESTDTGLVIVNISAINSAPSAGEDYFNTKQGESLRIRISDLVSNDIDPDRDVLMVKEWFMPENGTLVFHGDGTLTYTPRPNFHGSDRFRYTIGDGELEDTGLVVVDVSPSLQE